ncbi:MAG: sugar ABC transporter substrate-binding protein [Candidatus Marinimicrobia bacterium]|nr:sugar ABC transporter substrate-binding protein [Candidatus Neomarinimicrobiota bacterium]
MIKPIVDRQLSDNGIIPFRLVKLIGFVLVVVLFFAGCGKRAANELEFWALGVEGELVKPLITRFEQEYPGIKVRVQAIPWSAAHEKLLTAYAGNATPDLCQLGNTWIPEFVALRAIDTLDRRVHESMEIDPDNYFPGIWATNQIDGRLYGIPWYVDTRLLFYRTDLLRNVGYSKPPRTWPELLDVSRRLVQGGQCEYGILLPSNEWEGPVILGLANGSSLLRDNNCFGDFSGEPFSESFDFFLQFFKEGLSPLGMAGVTNIYQGFAEGYFAMLLTGPWNIGQFQRRLPAEIQNKWATAPLPTPRGSEPGTSLAGGASLVLFSTSDKKAAAWKLIEFLSRPAVQLEFYDIAGDLPAVKAAWGVAELQANPCLQAFYRQLRHVAPTPQVPEWEQIAQKVLQYGEVVAYGQQEPAAALEALDRDVNLILEKRRWLLSRDE